MDDMVDDPSLLDGQEGDFDPDDMAGGEKTGISVESQTLQQQTVLAFQELGIVIAVALMVGILFFLMLLVDKLWNSISEIYQKRFGEYKVPEDEEDPASLVGTFKRYK